MRPTALTIVPWSLSMLKARLSALRISAGNLEDDVADGGDVLGLRVEIDAVGRELEPAVADLHVAASG